VIYESGFYNEEQLKGSTWRWMGAEGVVKLKNTGQDMVLRIKGRAPVDAVIGEPPTIKFHLDGELLDQFTVTEKIFEREFKVVHAKFGDRKWRELKIATTKAIVPSQVNKKSLYRLTWLSVAGAPFVAGRHNQQIVVHLITSGAHGPPARQTHQAEEARGQRQKAHEGPARGR
jgi:hypothetical protein